MAIGSLEINGIPADIYGVTNRADDRGPFQLTARIAKQRGRFDLCRGIIDMRLLQIGPARAIIEGRNAQRIPDPFDFLSSAMRKLLMILNIMLKENRPWEPKLQMA